VTAKDSTEIVEMQKRLLKPEKREPSKGIEWG
jgi:hypothetical protein